RLTRHQKLIPVDSIRVRPKKLSPSLCRPPRRSKRRADKVRPADSVAALDTRNQPTRDTSRRRQPKEFAAAVNQKGSRAVRKRVRNSFWRSTHTANLEAANVRCRRETRPPQQRRAPARASHKQRVFS